MQPRSEPPPCLPATPAGPWIAQGFLEDSRHSRLRAHDVVKPVRHLQRRKALCRRDTWVGAVIDQDLGALGVVALVRRPVQRVVVAVLRRAQQQQAGRRGASASENGVQKRSSGKTDFSARHQGTMRWRREGIVLCGHEDSAFCVPEFGERARTPSTRSGSAPESSSNLIASSWLPHTAYASAVGW